MGTSRHDMVFYGVRLDYATYGSLRYDKDGNEVGLEHPLDEYWWRNEDRKGKDVLVIVSDGMSCKYALVGFILYVTGDDRWGENDGFPLMEIKEQDPKLGAMILDWVREKFGHESYECKTYVLSHYS